jgi:hypothetical protein
MTSNEDIQVTTDNDKSKDTQNQQPERQKSEEDRSGTNWKSFLNLEANPIQTNHGQTEGRDNIKITDDIIISPETVKPTTTGSEEGQGPTEHIQAAEEKPHEEATKPKGTEEQFKEEEMKPTGVEGEKPEDERKRLEEHHETTDVKSEDHGRKKRKGGRGKKRSALEEDTEQIAEHTRKQRHVDTKEYEKYESMLNRKTSRKRKTK